MNDASRTALCFAQAVVDRHWSTALEATQISWRYGFNPQTRPGPLGRMKHALLRSTRPQQTKEWADLRDMLDPLRWITVIGVTEPTFISDVFCEVTVKTRRLLATETGARKTPSIPRVVGHRFTLVCERGPYDPDPDGEWGVNPTSALRVVRLTSKMRFLGEVDAER